MAPQNLSAFSLNDKKYASFGQQGSAMPGENIGVIVGGFYSTATSTLNTGDYGMLQVDSAGNLMVNLAAGEEINIGTLNLGTLNTLGTVGVVNGGSIVVTKGTIAAGTINVGTITAATVNLVESGTLATLGTVGVVNSGTLGEISSVSNVASGTLLTLGTVGVVNGGSIVVTNGTIASLGGTAKVDLATLISGEDQTNDVLKTEQQFSYYHHIGTAGAVSGTVKSAAGFLHAVTVNTPGTSNLTVYNSVGTSATVIGIISGSVEQTKIYDVTCSTGITVYGTSAIDVTVSYR